MRERLKNHDTIYIQEQWMEDDENPLSRIWFALFFVINQHQKIYAEMMSDHTYWSVMSNWKSLQFEKFWSNLFNTKKMTASFLNPILYDFMNKE
jgi:hypothetical protein